MSKLHFYHSVMNAGKTTYLLQTYHNYKTIGKNILVIKPTIDTRDGKQNGWGTIKSRLIDEDTPCYYVDHIYMRELFCAVDKKIDVILVDEVQFFSGEDIEVLSNFVDKHNIPVICFGLKTDCNGNLFKGTSKLLAICDDVKEIKQICECGKKANMHVRLVDGKVDKCSKSVAVETGNVTYKSVCRKCYKKYKGE